jgi:hypothetical protein
MKERTYGRAPHRLPNLHDIAKNLFNEEERKNKITLTETQ